MILAKGLYLVFRIRLQFVLNAAAQLVYSAREKLSYHTTAQVTELPTLSRPQRHSILPGSACFPITTAFAFDCRRCLQLVYTTADGCLDKMLGLQRLLQRKPGTLCPPTSWRCVDSVLESLFQQINKIVMRP